MKVRLSAEARCDLDGIWDYTARRWNDAQADRYIRAISDSFAALGTESVSGRSINDVRQGYFKLPVGSHFLFYRVRGDGIDIVRILHQRMDVERHL